MREAKCIRERKISLSCIFIPDCCQPKAKYAFHQDKFVVILMYAKDTE